MFFQYRVSSSLIDAFLSYWEEEMALYYQYELALENDKALS